jgi:hypothetical protein
MKEKIKHVIAPKYMYKDNSLTLHINLHPHKKPLKVAKMDIS